MIREEKKIRRIVVSCPSMPSQEEYQKEIANLWQNHHLTNTGVLHNRLEKELANYLGVKHLLLFTNGHTALEAAIQVFSFPRGSEVITTPFTYISTTQAILRSGLVPIFADIDPKTLSLDPNSVESLISKRTVAILPVHVYGRVGALDAMQDLADRYKLKLIYDAAHAFGVKRDGIGIGAAGDLSMFSFHATKVFNTVEGGGLTFSDESLLEPLLALRNFGQNKDGKIICPAGNGKMTEFHAAMGLCNLRHVDDYIHYRLMLAGRYDEAFKEEDLILPLTEQVGVVPNGAYYPIIFKGGQSQRERVFNRLELAGISARKYFYPLTNDSRCVGNLIKPGFTPVAAGISDAVLCLPLHTELSLFDQDRIIACVKENLA